MSSVHATSVRIDPTNAEQLRSWDGEEGDRWAAAADDLEQALSGYDDFWVAATQIAPDERVLDVGCGTGATTRDAARRAGPAGEALGVDLSAAMLDVARSRARAEGLANARFLQADAQVHPFPAAHFDLLVSRTGAMFFGDPLAAFRNLGAAVRPGGRLVLLAWQPADRNEWLTAVLGALSAGRVLPAPPPDRPGPFGLSSPERVRDLLAASGWTATTCDDVRAPMRWGGTVDSAHRLAAELLSWLLTDLADDRRRAALAALERVMAEHQRPGGVLFGSAAWLVTARRPDGR